MEPNVERFKSILVDIDATAPAHPALERAVRLARAARAKLEFVVAHGIDLVVMGTVGRSGISGMLIGNTAERVLRKLPCSVLAVKPEGFVSPVRLDGPA